MEAAIEPLAFTSADGVALEGELAVPDRAVRAAAVLCHPHPQYGGTMRSLVIGELFRALPDAGVLCLRFNFRGVERSGGAWDEGRGELLDVDAAIATIVPRVEPAIPLVLAGWSFGADMALTTTHTRVAAWLAIAPPLHYADDFGVVGRDPRPKDLVLAERDQVQAPERVRDATSDWVATTIDVVAGADHFFVGRTDRVIAAAIALVDRMVNRA